MHNILHINTNTHTLSHTFGHRLPGRPWNRCPSSTGGWLAPHWWHLGILGAAVQVCELLQLGLSDLIIVILHTERHHVHTHTLTHTHACVQTAIDSFQLHCIKLRPLSPGLQPREYLINILYSTAVTAVPEAAKHFRSFLLINPRDPAWLHLFTQLLFAPNLKRYGNMALILKWLIWLSCVRSISVYTLWQLWDEKVVGGDGTAYN